MTLEQPKGHKCHKIAVWYCSWCGGKFTQRITDIKRGKAAKFCSRSCQASVMNRTRLGERNGNWKGGISSNNVHYKKLQDQRYPLKNTCRKITRQLILRGFLKREPCVVCGNPVSHAHHADYHDPYHVIWYCRKHHNELHGPSRRGNFNGMVGEGVGDLEYLKEKSLCKYEKCDRLAGYSGFCNKHNLKINAIVDKERRIRTHGNE